MRARRPASTAFVLHPTLALRRPATAHRCCLSLLAAAAAVGLGGGADGGCVVFRSAGPRSDRYYRPSCCFVPARGVVASARAAPPPATAAASNLRRGLCRAVRPRGIASPSAVVRARSFRSMPPSAEGDAAASSSSAAPSSDGDDQSSLSLPERICDAYRSGQTDAVLSLAPELLPNHSAEELILASVDAVGRDRKGQAAGIINALLGSCCAAGAGVDDVAAAETAWSLLRAYDDLSDEIEIYPDVVTLCLAHAALSRGAAAATAAGDDDGDRFDALAGDVLDRARRMAKKAGGSRRRRAVAASSRRTAARAADLAEELADRYGPELAVLHEDDETLVLSKPSGMVCFHRRRTTAGKVGKKKRGKRRRGGDDGKDDGGRGGEDAEEQRDRNIANVSLEDALADVGVPLSTLNPDGRGIVHRIDRGTSGCIVLAKTDEAHARLVAEFFTRGARKSYDALIPTEGTGGGGRFSALESSGEIDVPVGGRPALSRYEVIDRPGGGVVRLRVETMTGRKHQVRVHCAEGLGRPLFLDPVYLPSGSGAAAAAVPESIARYANGTRQRFFLHASALSIPRLGIDVEAPLPPWWEIAIEGLKEGEQ